MGPGFDPPMVYSRIRGSGEMVDTSVSGTDDCKVVGVQVPSSALIRLFALVAQQDRAPVS